jgi:N utilization substance protein A
VLSNGKRCPNEALPGSRYCGLPAHQALALQEDNGAEPAAAPAAVTAVETTSSVETPEKTADTDSDGAERAEPEAQPAAVPELAEVEQVPAGIPLDETAGSDGTEEHPPAA